MTEREICKLRGRILHTKIYILNFKYQTCAEISGKVLDGASFSNDATSDIRRTCSISLIPENKTLDLTNANVWIDKYIQVYCGIEDDKGEIVYTNMGIYLIDSPNVSYDATNNTLTLTGNDLMCKMTGLRNGYLEGIEYQIPQGSNIKDVLTTIVKDCGFTKYAIEEPSPTPTCPNQVSVSVGGVAHDLISQLTQINANYQSYFDVNGTFRSNQIPSGKDEQVRVTDDIWKKVLISYQKDTNFENVKNYIEVYGHTDEHGNTPMGVAKDENPQSPFYYQGTTGIIRLVCSGDEYDNIFTSRLAQERANYELYLHCKLQDSLTLECVPILWLDVNWLIEITLPNETKAEQYIIKSINTNLGVQGTQTITLMKYYPLYP